MIEIKSNSQGAVYLNITDSQEFKEWYETVDYWAPIHREWELLNWAKDRGMIDSLHDEYEWAPAFYLNGECYAFLHYWHCEYVELLRRGLTASFTAVEVES